MWLLSITKQRVEVQRDHMERLSYLSRATYTKYPVPRVGSLSYLLLPSIHLARVSLFAGYCIYVMPPHTMVTSLLILSICIALIDGFSSVAAPPISSKSVQVNTDKVPTNNEGFWKWRGHDIFTRVCNADKSAPSSVKKPTCILLHGFGASTTYWRETMSTLQDEGYDVHAIGKFSVHTYNIIFVFVIMRHYR